MIMPEEVLGLLVPTKVQNMMRDSEIVPKVLDALTIVGGGWYTILRERGIQSVAKHFSTENVTFDVPYGDHEGLFMDIYPGINVQSPSASIVFVHGGAWALGDKSMFRLLARRLQEQGFSVFVIKYRLYPRANANEQAADVTSALRWVQKHGPEHGCDVSKVFIVAHSSGAHISMLSTIRHAISCDTEDQTGKLCSGLFLLSGVYDIEAHHEHEVMRNINEFSFMKPANGVTTSGKSLDSDCRKQLRDQSPTHILRSLSQDITDQLKNNLPKIALVHGADDNVVPPSSSSILHSVLVELGLDPEHHELANCDHLNILHDIMLGTDQKVCKLLATFTDIRAKL